MLRLRPATVKVAVAMAADIVDMVGTAATAVAGTGEAMVAGEMAAVAAADTSLVGSRTAPEHDAI